MLVCSLDGFRAMQLSIPLVSKLALLSFNCQNFLAAPSNAIALVVVVVVVVDVFAVPYISL